jgi:hypothetical protein
LISANEVGIGPESDEGKLGVGVAMMKELKKGATTYTAAELRSRGRHGVRPSPWQIRIGERGDS